ncbi:MAG: class I SAM-dependent methyltransferase [Candidatus Omnitrophota bacterium]
MHLNTLLLFKHYALPYFRPHMKVLEIGPEKPPSSLQQMARSFSPDWETADVSSECRPTHLMKNEYQIPLPDGLYDLVVACNVLEHVRKTWLWIKELTRVCKSGGLVITITPATWPFHEYPVDCWRVFPEALRTLYQESGLDMLFCTCESLELIPEARLSRPHPSVGDPAPTLPPSSLGLKIEDLTPANRHRSGYKNFYPGMGNPCGPFKLWIKKCLGWPTSTSFDTLAIGRKPLPGKTA